MKKAALFTFLMVLPFTDLSFSQQTKEPIPPLGVFAYATNARHLVAIDENLDESNARSLTKAVCPTHAITSPISLTPANRGGRDAGSRFQYDAGNDVPSQNYCLLVDSKTHENLFVWGTGDPPRLLHEKKCLNDIAKAAEGLTGRKVASCYVIGLYGTGRVELVEYAYESADDRLVALMVIDDSMDDGPRYSITRFPADSPVWTTDNDGKFHPERFRHLFTISDDPDSKLWSIAIEWQGHTGRDLTLYRPAGNELTPVIVNHHFFSQKTPSSDIALR